MRIVPFEPRHASAWRDLNVAWITRWFSLEPRDVALLDDPQGQIIDKGGHVFVAEDDDGAVVGCVALLAMDDGGFEIAKMTVAESARGEGVGRRLMEACVDQAEAEGAPRLYLETNSRLTPALSLYQSAGFVQLPPADTPYARCDVWMERRL
ncbi:MAG: GNAT family N-acetyltransferase [Caulobacter sp.]|nr:GNAT family N-acetyltransferase [Caulobacter sp.]